MIHKNSLKAANILFHTKSFENCLKSKNSKFCKISFYRKKFKKLFIHKNILYANIKLLKKFIKNVYKKIILSKIYQKVRYWSEEKFVFPGKDLEKCIPKNY